jgi:energy-coupling factor transport system permease protein
MTTHDTPRSATTPAVSEPTQRGTILATRPLMGWRTVDLLTVAFLGVAFGVAYWGWGYAYEGPSNALSAVFPPLGAIVNTPWLIAGVVGGLVVRRPGAALFTETLAAVVEMLVGSQWGVTTLVSGLLQGVGVEIGLALFAYASFGIAAAMVAGALSAPLEAVYEWFVYWTDWGWGYKIAYAGLLTASAAVVAGLGGWLITTALARAGALNAFPPGQEARESRAV